MSKTAAEITDIIAAAAAEGRAGISATGMMHSHPEANPVPWCNYGTVRPQRLRRPTAAQIQSAPRCKRCWGHLA